MNCCYGEDVSSREEKEKMTAFYSHADISLYMLVSIAVWYTGPIGYGIAVKYTFYMFP